MRSGRLPGKLKAKLLAEGLRIAEEQGLARLIGDELRVFVRLDEVARKVHFSFRAIDDLSQDDPKEHWIRLR